jgi:CheY-like chemotaxis protein
MSDRASKPLRILIVEDEFFIALDIQAILEADGHSVVGVAVSAEEAVESAQALLPDVVLMDVRLARGSDGVEAARKIRAQLNIKSVFVTANIDSGTRERAASADPIGFVEKPVTTERLRQALSRV